MLTTAKYILFAKSTAICTYSFLVLAPYLPIISSSPMLPSSTCPFRSAFSTILSCVNILSFNPPGFAKNHFSPLCCCQPVKHTRLLYSVSTILPSVSWILICLNPLHLHNAFNQLLHYHYYYRIFSSISSIVE